MTEYAVGIYGRSAFGTGSLEVRWRSGRDSLWDTAIRATGSCFASDAQMRLLIN